tara:strand:- start:2404 stop:3120 length:717 start_codon:yes stop_codon:yes gene_type:complete
MSTMDNTEKTLANTKEATDAQESQTQENQASAEKTYSQKEVDDMMARLKTSVTRKVLRPYEELGDPTHLRSLVEDAEKRQQEEQIKRGEFEKTLQELAQKKDAEIQKRDSVIKEYKVNTPLIDAAARYDSVNPAQVKQLLSNKVRLSQSGDEVEILDDGGNVRYNDSGNLLSVDEFVKQWLNDNPHFKKAGVSTSGTKSNIKGAGKQEAFNLSKLDMTNPKDRQVYAEAKAKGLLNNL